MKVLLCSLEINVFYALIPQDSFSCLLKGFSRNDKELCTASMKNIGYLSRNTTVVVSI